MQDPFERLPDDIERDSALSKSKFERRRRAVETVRRFMRRSDDYRKPFLVQADKAQEMYECWGAQSKSVIQRANLRLPYAYLIVQTELPELANALLRDKPAFKVTGRKAVDFQYVDPLNDFHAMQLDAMSFTPKFISFLSSLLVQGTAVAKVPYKYREQVVTKRGMAQDPFYGVSYPTKEKVREVTFDGPDFENIPLRDFFPDWAVRNGADIENMRGCVHRTWKTYAELKSQEKKGSGENASGIYSNLDEVALSVNSKGVDAWGDPYYSADSRSDGNGHREDLKKKSLEVWEYWGLYDETGNGDLREYIITVVNGDVEVRCEDNFYDYACKPFIAAVNVMQPDEFYGISELFAVRPLIKEATTLRNARLDQVNLAVNRMWIVDRASGINAKTLYARPNGIVYTNDMSGIRELDAPEVPASSYREIQELTGEIQTTVGSSAGPSLSEAGRVFGRSATGASMVSNIAASRAGVKAKLIAELTLSRMCSIVMETNAQFVSEDQWVKVSDPNAPDPFVLLPREAFHTGYDFEHTTDLDGNPQEKLAKYQQFMQIAQVAEQSQPGTIMWAPVFEAIGRELLGREVKRFVRSDAERQQMQMQSLAAEQAANAATGQAAPQPNAAPAQGGALGGSGY